MLQIEVMKTEVIKYQNLVDSIKPHLERKDVKGNDTFDISDWRGICHGVSWHIATVSGKIPVLRYRGIYVEPP